MSRADRPPASSLSLFFFLLVSRSSSLRRPTLERHDTARGPQKKGEPRRAGDTAAQRRRRHTKGFLFARPSEGSGPGEHLIHSFLRVINLFKHQNHFASQEQERRLSFPAQSTGGGASRGQEGSDDTVLAVDFYHLKQKQQGREYAISLVGIILKRVEARSPQMHCSYRAPLYETASLNPHRQKTEVISNESMCWFIG